MQSNQEISNLNQSTPANTSGVAGQRKPYTPPAILHELALETRAGSLLGVDPLNDLFGIDNK